MEQSLESSCRSRFMKIIHGIHITSGTHFDAMRALIDPANNNHFFISTWGSGLLEYENNLLINNYN